MTMTIDEIMNSPGLRTLYERWQDEKEYEDWNDYTAAITRWWGCEVLDSDSDQFRFTVQLDDGRYRLHVAESEDGKYLNVTTEAL